MPSNRNYSKEKGAAVRRRTDNFEPTFRAEVESWDDDELDPEATTYWSGDHGPDPVPDWVITSDEARQYELGMLKTGKEADVHLVERRHGDRVNLLAAKRYRGFEDRMFRNDAKYREGRRTGVSRVDRAMAKGTRRGMGFRAAQWVETEFDTLSRLWSAGVAVPYPVQKLGHEVMLEFIGDDDEGAAPRLVQTKPNPRLLASLWEQTVENLRLIARCGLVHGDLSAYNMLVWQDRLVLIDFPQAVDAVTNRAGLSLLERDVSNVCTWFSRQGLEAADPGWLLAEIVAEAY